MGEGSVLVCVCRPGTRCHLNAVIVAANTWEDKKVSSSDRSPSKPPGEIKETSSLQQKKLVLHPPRSLPKTKG